MTYQEAIDFLYSLRLFGTKLGLENTFALAKLNGDPHRNLKFIHVAGTNGKGSTCAMLESIYRASKLRTGLFTSPHLVSFTERLQVDRQPISEAAVARLTDEMISRLGGADLSQWPFRPTFFEFVTVMALLFFKEQECDLVIWETGMGGRLDATNIVTPIASVITNIQFDHQQWLGESLQKIAAEKAGIIKPGIPVVTGIKEDESLQVVRRTAHERGAPLHAVLGDLNLSMHLPLFGAHQRLNASLALAVVDVLQSVLPVSEEAKKVGLHTVSWPGRLQLVSRDSREFLLDGAHNPDGARALVAALKTEFRNRPITLVLGLFRDKAWQEMCETLIPAASRVFLVPVQSERTADPRDVQCYCRQRWPNIEVESHASIRSAIHSLEQERSESLVVIAGSLHLVGEAMEALGITANAASERNLNEWDATNKDAQAN